jgi:malate dehydrogenase (oxaloacetate-decarboxylating)
MSIDNEAIEINLAGFDLLNRPLLNKGTAFTESERDLFHLHGLLPSHVGTLEEQVTRRLRAAQHRNGFRRYAFLRDLQDMNETLFYALLVRHIEELLPLVYTPTVGEGCQRFSEIWRKARGVFLSYPNKSRIPEILANPHFDRVRVIVVSDGGTHPRTWRSGRGWHGNSHRKARFVHGLCGHSPGRDASGSLDVGTNNRERLADPLYIGWRHERIRGADMTASSRLS